MNNIEHLFLIGGVLLLLFFIVGYYFQRVKFPSLLAYVFLAVAISGFLDDQDLSILEHVSRTGIVLLFFLLGLHFPLTRLFNISRRVWKVGAMDIVLNFGVTFLLAFLFGFDLLAALIIGGVAYATSSSITVKMLEESRRLNSPEGEFKLALLIFEDLAAPVMVSFMVGLTTHGNITIPSIGWIFFKVVLLTTSSIFIAYYGFRRLDVFVNRHMSKDFMPLFAISIALIFAGIAEAMDLSKLLGAFLAGVMLSETGASKELGKIINPIKDFFLPFFFFWFGTSITLGTGIVSPGALAILIIWAIVGKVIIGFWGGRLYGLSYIGSLRASFSLVQRGEFSVVIAALAEAGLRVFLGVYIVVTAFVGVYLFRKAPVLADKLNRKFNKKRMNPAIGR